MKNQSGIVLIEALIYLPLVMVIFFAFVVGSLVMTQRVLLDRAVARATLEAANWLSTDMAFGADDPFIGGTRSIRPNPYARLISSINPFSVDSRYFPANRESFTAEVERRVREYARIGILGSAPEDALSVSVTYRSYVVMGDLIVSARMSANAPDIPIVRLIGNWQFNSSATARVIRHANLMNDVSFIFDAVRIFTDADIRKLQELVGKLPERLDAKMSASNFFRSLSGDQ